MSRPSKNPSKSKRPRRATRARDLSRASELAREVLSAWPAGDRNRIADLVMQEGSLRPILAHALGLMDRRRQAQGVPDDPAALTEAIADELREAEQVRRLMLSEAVLHPGPPLRAVDVTVHGIGRREIVGAFERLIESGHLRWAPVRDVPGEGPPVAAVPAGGGDANQTRS